jgi:periplasmic protein TonB
MEPLAMLHADPLDLLFENRNKLYGAYPLRKYYNQRLLISLGCTCSLVVVFAFAYLYNSSGSLSIQNKALPPDVVITEVNLNPEIKPPVQTLRPPTVRPPATITYSTPLIVADAKAPDPMAKIDQLQTTAIGLTTSAGEQDNGEPPINSNGITGAPMKKTDPVEDNTEILDRAEVMPEFPGGLEGLKRFLLMNLRMPENNLEEGSRVQVIVRFVVGTDGRVRDVEITHPGDSEFNAEVRRVISKMPDWKPASQNHRTVAVYFSLPVNFVREE